MPAPEPRRAGTPPDWGGHRQGEPWQYVHLVDALVLALVLTPPAKLFTPGMAIYPDYTAT